MGHVMCPVTLPLVVAGDGGGCLKLRALAGRSLSVFLSLSIQAVAYLPVEYSSRARNGDRYGKEAEMHNELGCVSCSVLPFCFSDRPPKIFLPRRFYPEGTSLLVIVQLAGVVLARPKILILPMLRKISLLPFLC